MTKQEQINKLETHLAYLSTLHYDSVSTEIARISNKLRILKQKQ